MHYIYASHVRARAHILEHWNTGGKHAWNDRVTVFQYVFQSAFWTGTLEHRLDRLAVILDLPRRPVSPLARPPRAGEISLPTA